DNGIDTEAAYPYHGMDETCHFDKSAVGETISGYVNISRGDEEALKSAVALIGPISVLIVASPSFQHYGDGVYYEEGCSSEDVNHAVLVVGYGTDPRGGDYWLVKNSWGTSWGEKGYIRMARNRDNNCDIASYASYPVVNDSSMKKIASSITI
ncbi:hypothetical protein PMAYCL1PPCAC_01098, partial [Pristionchus mayeri]